VLFQFANFGRILDIKLDLRWDPAEFAAEVYKRATTLSAADIGAGSIVIVAHSGSARFFADLFAVWTLGCTAACIDPALTPTEVRTLVEFVEPSAILLGEAPAAHLDGLVGLPIFELSRAISSQASLPAGAGDPNRPALILFTSGTTGHPKGVVLPFGSLLNRMAFNRAAMGHASRMKALVTLPTSFGHGLIGNALTPLMSGGEIVLHPLGLSLAQKLGQIIDQYRIGFLSSVPSFWRMALKFSNPPIGNSLARIHVGSAPLSARLWTEIAEWSRAEVVNCYGITELANWVAGASSRIEGISDGAVGKPWGGEVAIRDSNGAVHNAGEGELVVKSPSVMSGYFRRPDLTAAAFVSGWYSTGDVGYIGEGGLIRLTGRIKDEINRGGFKVQPSEVDNLLETHPAVSEACVFGMPDAASGEIVAAAVRLMPHKNLSIDALRQWCAARLRREAIPERWFLVDELPRNQRGKINRDTLRRMLSGEAQ
jgi:acyl-CoA synthetase (AMP-forming)/AMP-acid ligase II